MLPRCALGVSAFGASGACVGESDAAARIHAVSNVASGARGRSPPLVQSMQKQRHADQRGNHIWASETVAKPRNSVDADAHADAARRCMPYAASTRSDGAAGRGLRQRAAATSWPAILHILHILRGEAGVAAMAAARALVRCGER